MHIKFEMCSSTHSKDKTGPLYFLNCDINITTSPLGVIYLAWTGSTYLTKSEAHSFIHSNDRMGTPKLRGSRDADHIPLRECFVIRALRLATMTISTKSEVSKKLTSPSGQPLNFLQPPSKHMMEGALQPL